MGYIIKVGPYNLSPQVHSVKILILIGQSVKILNLIGQSELNQPLYIKAKFLVTMKKN